MPRGMPPGAWFTTLERSGRTVYVGHSLPIRIRYEADWGDALGSEPPFVKYFYRDRWLASWAIEARSLLDGSLDRALKDPVRLNIYMGGPPGEFLEGGMYAESLYSSEPAIDLGPLRLDAPRVYGPDERGQAAIDAVLHCLYGKPWVAAERLITDITSKGIFG